MHPVPIVLALDVALIYSLASVVHDNAAAENLSDET
jgi:hypothetical protein